MDIDARFSHVAATDVEGTHATNIPATIAASAV
jgi:hypothetical protein